MIEHYDILDRLRSAIVDKSVPKHRHSVWYYTGGLTLLAFGIQVITGLLLLYYFEPGAGSSAKSLEMIVRHVPFGWFVRSLHAWSASVAILLTLVHMMSAFFVAAYRGKGGRALWTTGVPLLLLVLAFGYTGSALTQVQSQTLRFYYTLHVAVLPLMSMLLVGVHLFLSLVVGNSVPSGVGVVSNRRFFPEFVLSEIIVWLSVLALVLIVAWYLPWEFNGSFFAPKDAFQLSIPTDWYTLWQHGWLDRMPALIYWTIVLAALVLLSYVPKFAKDRHKLIRRIGVAVLLLFVALSFLAYFSSPADFNQSAISRIQPGGAQDTVVTPDHP